MKSRMGGISRMFLQDKLMGINSNSDLPPEIEENVIEWTTLFRRNWDIYAEFYLGIPLKPYQRAALHEIGISDTFFWRAGRNGAKSFVTAIAAICKLMLYPNCWVVVTASTVDQANKIVNNKIEKELIKKLSPYLRYFFEKGWLKITKPTDGYVIENTLNNSTLTVMGPVPSSRGSRSNFTIYDEVAVMKKSDIDQIFEGMLFPRQPEYFNNPKYANNPRWIEESKAIYLTSSRYKYQWWYRLWKDCVTGHYMDRRSVYNVFATDYFDNIANGLKTWGDFRRAKRTMNDYDFRMEMLNEAIGESEDAYFTLKEFKENQELTECFRPPRLVDLYSDIPRSMEEKDPTEIRMIIADLAFSGSHGQTKNDNSVFMCMSLHWKKYRFERHVDYIETKPGGGANKVIQRLKELFQDYQADYLAFDIRNGGEAVYDYLSSTTENEDREIFWNPCGYTIEDDMTLQVMSQSKIDELRGRTVDPNALHCLIPIAGGRELNSVAWQSLKKQLNTNNIKFLISMQDAERELVDSGEYFTLTSEEYADKLAPYGQTDMLIKECVELNAEFKEGLVRLTENPGGYKDRAVVLAYANLIAERLDTKYAKSFTKVETDISNIQLVW